MAGPIRITVDTPEADQTPASGVVDGMTQLMNEILASSKASSELLMSEATQAADRLQSNANAMATAMLAQTPSIEDSIKKGVFNFPTNLPLPTTEAASQPGKPTAGSP